MDKVEAAFEAFKADQTLSNLQVLKNLGLEGVRILRNNEWRPLGVYELPLENLLLLYRRESDGVLRPYAVGTY